MNESIFSFRDPAGSLQTAGGRLIRLVTPEGAADIERALTSPALSRARSEGRLAGITPINSLPADLGPTPPVALAFECERVNFPSYPYEWPAVMLHSAAALTLDLLEALLPEGLGLKDATPFNVLFEGPRAVFVDWGSFERRDPRDPQWLAYGQFARTFLLPLLLHRHKGLSFDRVFLSHPEGLPIEAVYQMLSFWQRLSPPALGLVSVPVWLSGAAERKGAALYERRLLGNSEQALFVLRRVLRGLRKTLGRLAPPAAASSAWSGYQPGAGAAPAHYGEAAFASKEEFVRECLKDRGIRRVLDVGCNRGHFSLLAASLGASVVAIDSDPAPLDALWRDAAERGADVLPLAVDFARPSPAVGWDYKERLSFLDRARGRFDCVMFLASIHHLLVTERIPLPRIVQTAAALSTRHAVVEFVPKEDPMFERLLRGRGHLYQSYDRNAFEAAWSASFEIAARRELAGTGRCLYFLSKRPR